MAKSKGKSKADKADKSSTTPTASPKSYSTLADLRADRDIWYKVLVLIYDLRNIKNDKASENRTLQTIDPLYISTPYFTSEEAAAVKAVKVDNENTLEHAITKAMENFFEKRKASGDARPCGPHDMVPVYLECFGVEKGEIEEEKLVSRVRRSRPGA
ncbi:hypothetical protein B0A48_02175 [Cryoendolithus antarcticus]|uniref:Uncharacterized protein n=1 Tax=Cryoendolithus antarcticus TaxID=1507870 RepID=A0A1V8TN76_9PEZI|nr:hypothetical protein B0A48_02175 [Cryoendolithus antarcticus]